MIIDWYTIIFQIINFLILVFLLRYFLYGPIIRTMDEREQKIVQREDKAAELIEEADKEAQAYQRKSEDLHRQEEEIMEKARAVAEKEKHELLDKARQEVDEIKQRWEDDFEREKETFISELRLRIGQQACSVARRCLKQLADARLEELIWNIFLKKLGAMPAEELTALQETLAEGDHKIFLRSAFEPPEEALKELKNNLREILSDRGSALNLSTKIDSNLVCGIELDAGGYRVAWSIDSYLEDVEEQILKELEQAKPADHTEEGATGGKTET